MLRSNDIICFKFQASSFQLLPNSPSHFYIYLFLFIYLFLQYLQLGCIHNYPYLAFYNIFSFPVHTGPTKTSLRCPSVILRRSSNSWPSLDRSGTTERSLDHSLGKLESSSDCVVFSDWLTDRISSLVVRIKRRWPVRQNWSRWPRYWWFQFLRFKTGRERWQHWGGDIQKPPLLAPWSIVGTAHARRQQFLRLHDRILLVLLWRALHVCGTLRLAKTRSLSVPNDCRHTGQSHSREADARHVCLHIRCRICCVRHSVHLNGSESRSPFESHRVSLAGVWWRTTHVHSIPINISDSWFSCGSDILLSHL